MHEWTKSPKIYAHRSPDRRQRRSRWCSVTELLGALEGARPYVELEDEKVMVLD